MSDKLKKRNEFIDNCDMDKFFELIEDLKSETKKTTIKSKKCCREKLLVIGYCCKKLRGDLINEYRPPRRSLTEK